MLKVNNKDTRTTLGVVLVSLLLTLNNFTPCSSVSIVNFEHVIADWEDESCSYTQNFQEAYLGNHNFPKSFFFHGSYKTNNILKNIGLGLIFSEKYEKPHLIDWMPAILLNSNG